jgi:predicted transcriptional regulator
MPQKSSGNTKMEELVSKLEAMVRVCRTDSCLHLYSYLLLFGSSTPAELRQQTGISNATVFRALALLCQAGIIEREDDESVADRRHRRRYLIARDLIDESRSVLSRRLREHMEFSSRGGLLAEFAECLNTLPMNLTNYVTELLLSCGAGVSCEKHGEVRIMKAMAFRVDDVEDFNSILVLLNQLVEGFDVRRLSAKRDWRKPLKRPVMLSLNLIASETSAEEEDEKS